MHDGSTSTPAWYGQDALRDALVRDGFRLGLVLGFNNACNWRAYKRPSLPASPVAEALTKYLEVAINPYANVIEVDLTGEIAGVRHRVMACGLSPDGLTEALPQIEARLMQAWNALAQA